MLSFDQDIVVSLSQSAYKLLCPVFLSESTTACGCYIVCCLSCYISYTLTSHIKELMIALCTINSYLLPVSFHPPAILESFPVVLIVQRSGIVFHL